MLQLLWSLLNIILLISFIVICFRSVKLVREHYGWYGAVILSIGLLSFVSNPKPASVFQEKEINPREGLDRTIIRSKTVTLHEDITTEYVLTFFYSKKLGSDEWIVHTSSASVNGLVAGTDREIKEINVTKQKDTDIVHYFVTATNKWKLMGFTVCNEGLVYEGSIRLNDMP